MVEKNVVQTMTHDLSNKLMILEGYITLMQLDSRHINSSTLQKLSSTLNSATAILSQFKSSEEYNSFCANNNKK